MAQRADKPPILRVLILLVALVGVALALAALSPAVPEGGLPATGSTESAAVTPTPGTRP